MNLFEAIIVAIVEGLTEYLPVSSTGHMIITSALLGIGKDEFTKLYEISIQLGAILAVVVLYWRKFFDFSKWKFYLKLIIAVIPAIIPGFLFSDQIDALLESPLTVAITLLTGGIIFLFIDRFFQYHEIEREEKISNKKAFIIGIWQCLAMIPGVSRSASSIIGGMQQRLTRKLAAEFSFYLAVPTMAAATGYSVFLKNWKDTSGVAVKGYELILASSENTRAFITGNIIAFIVAILAIKFFIGFLQKHGFVLFGWYRIIAGILLLILIMSGVISE
ncbi:MAG TPA: undecaprenyl-diphosphate phosphatase [Flavitalea sp.]|nr:undecaprenyl-diphosphate phosphatase [Flavitalea sp.]